MLTNRPPVPDLSQVHPFGKQAPCRLRQPAGVAVDRGHAFGLQATGGIGQGLALRAPYEQLGYQGRDASVWAQPTGAQFSVAGRHVRADVDASRNGSLAGDVPG
jgi:hypothetical protein